MLMPSMQRYFEIELDEIRPMVALPGDPRNGIPIDELPEEVRIDAAYGGSCTGGKMADMDMYAEVLQNALDQGKRVAPGVHLYLQFGSQKSNNTPASVVTFRSLNRPAPN